MQKKYFNKLITSVLIVAFVVPLPYLVSIQTAKAQVSGGYSAGGGYGGVNAGIGGYLSGLAPAITQLPLCKEKIGGVVQNLFRKSNVTGASSNIIDSATEAELHSDIEGKANFEATSIEDLDEIESIKVYDPTSAALQRALEIQAKASKKSLEALEGNDTCYKSIGRMVIKLMLQKITLSTVAWIQGGINNGSPAFLENPKSFFNDIAKNEILQFGLDLNVSADCSAVISGNITDIDLNTDCVSPYGKAFLIAQADAFNSHFAQNAQYSLNKLIQETTPQYSGVSFQADFSAGGWNAWTALTSVPANNPLGFQIMASNELSRRLEGTYKSNAEELRDALNQADGYLGDQRCVDPQGMTKAESDALLEAGDKENVCRRWEYVTPGQMVADAATKLVNYPENNLLKAEDLNDAVAAVLDALLARYSPDLMNLGLSGISNQGADGGFVLDSNGLLTGPDSQTMQDFSRFQLGTQWLQDHPNFNIRTDVTQALIDEQRIYRTKLENQNDVLKDLNKTIYQLDYCIPGPHPGWEQDSREVLSAVENTITSKTAEDFKDLKKEQVLGLVTGVAKASAVAAGLVIGASIGTAIPVPIVGTLIGAAIGVIVGLLIDFFTNQFFGPSSQDLLELYYSTITGIFTGLHMDNTDNGDNGWNGAAHLRNKQEVVTGLDTMLYRYTNMIHKYFTPEFLPPVAKDAAKEFRKAIGYNQTINDNNDKVILLNGIIKRLTVIKDGIQELNDDYPEVLAGTASPVEEEAYEAALEDFKGEFARLTSNMVTGDDIAVMDNLTKQAKDEIKYVYNDLLTGPYGCEQDLRNNNRQLTVNSDKTWILRSTKRALYPAELWYDYNEYAYNAVLPVPQELKDKLYTEKSIGNQMPPDPATLPGWPAPGPNGTYVDYLKLGPGFLSGVIFDSSESENTTCAARIESGSLTGDTLDCLTVSDLFNRGINNWPVSVGRKQGIITYSQNSSGNWVFDPNATDTNEQKDNSFEQTIGVY